MSVELHTDRAALAGSEQINSAPGGESDAATALNDPGATGSQDGTPKRTRGGSTKRQPTPAPLVLTCARCHRAILGSGAGFAFCDLRECHKAAVRTATGYIDPAKARWTLAHRGCAPEALAPMSGCHVVWVDRIDTTDALLDAVARLSWSPWFGWSDWGSLVRNILAETETAHTGTVSKRANRPTKKGLPPGDHRHGTYSGYDWHGCRCDQCKAAKAERDRADKERIER